MITRILAVAAFAALVLTGCADTPNGGGTPTTASESTGEPSPEPTDPESTQTEVDKPSIKIATAPIGGAPDEGGVRQCTPVSWLADDFPDGTTVTLESPELDPTDIFVLDQSACSDDRRQCVNVVWTTDDHDSCFVGGRQVAAGGKNVHVLVPAKVTCATEEDCARLDEEARKRGSQVYFITGPLETTETPPTEPPPTESSPTESSPTETPSDG